MWFTVKSSSDASRASGIRDEAFDICGEPRDTVVVAEQVLRRLLPEKGFDDLPRTHSAVG
jgi:hypothetical protein